ncbi:methyltransferase domain-containing protein [Paenibacillus oryzisoli]|uniref:Methyltransferase type 11 domain-containing protein n=1 Tax=Paenibacillus oryzisoli TaxID=1850517 RepID=A0A198AK20_9BACL|nr:methyltransferase domain-containing protein [Paenibacillus oryzisoli]OAS21834.1 hypothetical protein A8708_06770 [Paenibacillus oryzisoli]
MLSTVRLVCPACKSLLETTIYEMNMKCTLCSAKYRQHDGIPIMLPDQYDAHKEGVKRMFTSMNESLEEKGLSRFSTFINWGYVPLEEDTGGSFRTMSNSVRLLDEVMEGIDLTGKNVLEVACGRGGNIRVLLKKYKPKSVIGLDLTESNITFCHRHYRNQQAYFCVGDAEHLPFADNSFDIVLNIEASDLYPNMEGFLEEVYRVLRHGGVFLYADDLPVSKLRKSEAYTQNLGFQVRTYRDVTKNAIHSCESSLSTRLKTLNDAVAADGEIMASLGAPGTDLVKEMKEGKRLYTIRQLIKPS